MKLGHFVRAAAVASAFLAMPANAFEYKLLFTPNPGAQGLAVAGYQFVHGNVVGNCSYYTVHSGSGKGGGYHTVKTYYNQTCTWDRFGNLLGIVAGAPTAPSPLYTNGTQTVYAQDGRGDTAGIDTNGVGGFVNAFGPHYTWLTSQDYAVIPQQTTDIVLKLKSDGDVPLIVTGVSASAASAPASVKSTTCESRLRAGEACKIVVQYNPGKFCSPTGLAYDTLTATVAANSGVANDFVQHYTIELTPRNSNSENCGP